MKNWKYRISIREYLTEEESKEAMVAAAVGIRSEVERGLPPALSNRLGSTLSALDRAAGAGELDWFNASLSRFWDFCDDNDIWVIPTAVQEALFRSNNEF